MFVFVEQVSQICLHLNFAGPDLDLHREHLGQVEAALVRAKAVFFVVRLNQPIDHAPIDADHEYQPRNVEIELKGLKNLERD